MQLSQLDIDAVLKRLSTTEPSMGMQARVLCSCKSRLYQTSCARRRDAVRLAAVWSVGTVVLGWVALKAHHSHVRLKANFYGG